MKPLDSARLYQAVDEAERTTGLQFCVCLCRPEGEPRAQAERLFAELGLERRPAALVAVVPETRRIEVLRSAAAGGRLDDRDCAAAVAAIVTGAHDGDLVDGIVGGIEVLAAAAGEGSAKSDDLPDVLDAR